MRYAAAVDVGGARRRRDDDDRGVLYAQVRAS
jgi:hypothetical protein